jgi:two-component system, NtrC family, sensor kinase
MCLRLPVLGSELSDFELADTVMINQSLELSHQFYEEFENDSNLFYAAQALGLSRQLFYLEDIESDEQLFNRIIALTIESYVLYARAILETDIQAAEDTLMAGLNLLQETNILEKAAIYSELGSIYERKGQNDEALQFSKKALELYKTSGDKKSYLYQLINMGLVLRVKGNYGESLEYLMESLKIGRQVNDSTAIVESLLAMGFVYAFVEKWDDALKSQQEALAIYQQANNQWGIARIHNDMGVTYELAGILDSSMVHHQAALAIRLKFNDNYNTFASYLYIGDIHAKQGNIKRAIEYYEKGLPFGDQIGYKIAIVDANLRLGDYYLQLSEINNSMEKYEIALQKSREIGDLTGESRANMGLAGIAMINGEYAKANEILKLAEKTVPKSNLQIRKVIYKEIAETYFKLGDHKNAYLNSLNYSKMKDSVQSAENISKITQLTNIMEFENEMALKKESNEKLMAIKQEQINRERMTRNIFLAGMLIAVVLVVITFIRFIEKKKLNNKLNETLRNLKAAQNQLILKEKMASLGELTAGIAHEIQNPLNFVNNFSEVNMELIAELKEELEAGNLEDIKAIADDIAINEEKILQHGKRADSIVKGMLQHSRSSNGQKELTDINTLCDEYLRLSYHGLRAKDKSFNADFKTEFDASLPKINIIPQDIGRILLNLINNAFYVVAERQRNLTSLSNLSDLDSHYQPTVTVSTKSLGNRIEISVKDNGNGIPDEIKNKIFQPFFTTKPTGQGTGLGLSLAYDIVKAHGGELRVETKEGEGSEFVIQLPIF